MMSQKSSLTSIVRRNIANIKQAPLLVVLHGEGGNEEELFELFHNADDRLVILSIKAPFKQSESKFLWYTTTRYLNDYIANPAQIEYSRQQILTEIRYSLDKYNCDSDQVYLYGFGQGGVMAINIFLSEPEKITAIAISNARFLEAFHTLKPEEDKYLNKKVLISHGILNQIYPVELGRMIRQEFSKFPLEIDYQEYDIGHYYSLESIKHTFEWITNHLDKEALKRFTSSPEYSPKLIACKIVVGDLDRAINFYSRYLGMKLVERTGKAFAFLTNNQSHHVVELQVEKDPSARKPGSIKGVNSMQFEVKDKMSFAKIYQILTSERIQVIATDKIICWSLIFYDPDGNEIEIVWDTRKLPGKSDFWQGRELPLTKQQIIEQ